MSKDRSVNRSETEESLRRQLDEITRLAEGLVHRVKNSLSTIQMRMGLLTEEIEKDSEPIFQNRILKKCFRNKFRPQRISGHKNRFRKITELRADVRGRY